MLLFPIPKFRSVISEKRRVSFHIFPLLKMIPARRRNRDYQQEGGPRQGGVSLQSAAFLVDPALLEGS